MEIPPPLIQQVREKPDEYWKKAGYPSKEKGILLAWFIKQLSDVSHLDLVTRVRIHKTGTTSQSYYFFKPENLLVEANSDAICVELFSKIGVDRFEMRNGSFYSYKDGDGLYTHPHLEYHDAVIKNPFTFGNFDELLTV